MAITEPGFVTAEGQRSDLEQLERDTRKLQQALQEVRATGESADGFVVATVGGRGELVELALDPRIYRAQDCEALAADILAAVRQGADRAQREVFTAAKGLIGPVAAPDGTDLEFEPFLRIVAKGKGGAS